MVVRFVPTRQGSVSCSASVGTNRPTARSADTPPCRDLNRGCEGRAPLLHLSEQLLQPPAILDIVLAHCGFVICLGLCIVKYNHHVRLNGKRRIVATVYGVFE